MFATKLTKHIFFDAIFLSWTSGSKKNYGVLNKF